MLTVKQHQTYEFIRHYVLRHGYAPTEAEIAAGIGIRSRGVVHRYVTALAQAGVIEVISGARRNIRLCQQDDVSIVGLPIIGSIAAGQPIEAVVDEQVLNITDKLLKPNHFLLKVKGDSMIGDNICDGDYVVCEASNTAKNDNIVVALIDSMETTLKRIKREKKFIILIPSNPTLQPMRYEAERVMIQGIYKGLLRFNI